MLSLFRVEFLSSSVLPKNAKIKIYVTVILPVVIQGVPEGKVNILGGYSIRHSKQKTLYEHVFYSERFPR